jgi:monoamine oxidase
MDWPGDVWSLASYSFPAPGQVTALGPTLRSGVGRLHFAGEHTNYAFVGYMEGALQSGLDVSRKLAARDGVVRSGRTSHPAPGTPHVAQSTEHLAPSISPHA